MKPGKLSAGEMLLQKIKKIKKRANTSVAPFIYLMNVVLCLGDDAGRAGR